jgi:hypothetical protein
MSHFRPKHGGQSPQQVLGRNDPNALICDKCYKEVTSENLPDLQHGFAYSLRNGFGPIPMMPPHTDGESPLVTRCRELQALLRTLTSAEEAAIRRITPLISIVRLAHGNIGSKGNTSCVWQQSKLATVLPNLPSECKFIIITRQDRANGAHEGLKSTKFSRKRIERVLTLLAQTGHEAWADIEISQENLEKWPETGDLCNLNSDMVIIESDKDGNVVDPEGNVIGNVNGADQSGDNEVHVLADGDDLGPAPLQNDTQPDETFEGVVDISNSTNVAGGNAEMIAASIADMVRELRSGVTGQDLDRGQGQDTTASDEPPPPDSEDDDGEGSVESVTGQALGRGQGRDTTAADEPPSPDSENDDEEGSVEIVDRGARRSKKKQVPIDDSDIDDSSDEEVKIVQPAPEVPRFGPDGAEVGGTRTDDAGDLAGADVDGRDDDAPLSPKDSEYQADLEEAKKQSLAEANSSESRRRAQEEQKRMREHHASMDGNLRTTVHDELDHQRRLEDGERLLDFGPLVLAAAGANGRVTGPPLSAGQAQAGPGRAAGGGARAETSGYAYDANRLAAALARKG